MRKELEGVILQLPHAVSPRPDIGNTTPDNNTVIRSATLDRAVHGNATLNSTVLRNASLDSTVILDFAIWSAVIRCTVTRGTIFRDPNLCLGVGHRPVGFNDLCICPETAQQSDLQGVSLVPYSTRPTPPKHPPVFVEMVKDATHSDRRAIIDWPWKLHYGITFDAYQLYDLSRDPHEQDEVSEQHPEVFERLQTRLRQWMSEEVEPATPRR